MAKLIIHDASLPKEQIAQQREQAFLHLSPKEKIKQLLALNKAAVALNGGQPIKQPQGKGLIIQKKI